MSGDDNPKKRRRRTLSLVLSLVSFAVLTLIAVTLISGGESWFSRLTGLFTPRSPAALASEYDFDIGRNRVFAETGGAIAAAGTLGIQVLDSGGRETFRDSFRMIQPAIIEIEGLFLSFDIGGTAVRVFSTSQLIASIEANGSVVSASVNKNGWLCVVTQEGGGSKGVVTVYNSLGKDIYEVSLGSGYILSAVISPDNHSLAILNLADSGSRITFYHGITTDKDEPDSVFELTSGLLIDMWYQLNGNVLAVSTESLLLIDNKGAGRIIYSYTDKRLGGYTHSGGFITLHLYDYGIGYSSRLLTLLEDGTVLGDISIDREIISMSSRSGSLVILRNDGLTFYSDELEELSASADSISAAGANRVLALESGAALATSDNSAIILTRGEAR